MARMQYLGRQKTKLEKIQNPNPLDVTFSKSSDGFFKKTHEFSTVCGAEVDLIICFSPVGMVLNYGILNVVKLMEQFLRITLERVFPLLEHIES